MNNSIRKEIDKLINRINAVESSIQTIQESGARKETMISRLIELMAEVDDIQSSIMEYADDEQSKVDNLPENLLDSARGQALQDSADYLSEASEIDSMLIQDIIDALEQNEDIDWDIDYSEIVEALENAKGY